MVRFSSLIYESKPSSMVLRRQLALTAIIMLTMPMCAQPVFAHRKDVASTASTKDALKLLSSPTQASLNNNDIDFHGLTIPFSQLFNSTNSYAEEALADQLEQENRSHDISIKSSTGQRATFRVNAAIYPPKDKIPDVSSPQVKAWLAEIDWSKVPNIPVAQGLPDVPHFPKCPPDDQVDRASCWWSCAGCVAPSDIITCPDKNSWGLTYDDGPSLATKEMVQFLGEKNVSATFFIVGSRVLDYPEILKDQVAKGHHIAMHTWSHAGLTTLTNQEIVAEIRWSEKIIRDVTGLTMKYVRPPYGDIDNRVREILRQMGYTTVIWSAGWDTNDWRMLQNQVQEWEIVQSFQNNLGKRDAIKSASGAGGFGGPITLEHDLTAATISLSKKLIPMAMSRGLKPMSLAYCLNDQEPYQRGSKLGPGGARDKSNNGESRNTFRGMRGMEEQDFVPTVGSSKSAAGSRNTGGIGRTNQGAVAAIAGLAAVFASYL